MNEDKIRAWYIGDIFAPENNLAAYLHVPEDIASRLVLDPDDPEYVFVSPFIYGNAKWFYEFKKYYYLNNDSDYSKVFIFHSLEAVEPDLNIFDYAITCCSLINCSGRTYRVPPNLLWLNAENYVNAFTYQDALNKIKNNNVKFCNFIYSNSSAHPIRDQLFYKLSEYKRVDSLGPHLNNVNTEGSRAAEDWYKISVELKSNYKFSIAAENAVFNGYTSEKLLSSFQAHTVPIYFGNPKVASEYNPEAFINVNDYADLDALLKKIKEIDEDDELWAKMVSAPWQTDEQIEDYNQKVLNYKSFVKNLFNFNVNIKEKKRLPVGTWATWYANWYMNRDYVLLPQRHGLDLKLRQAARCVLKSLGLINYYDKLKTKLR